jgi:hypothetical protein
VHDMERIQETAKSKSEGVDGALDWRNCFSPVAHIDPIEREIRELAESIFAIKDEQEYIVARERQHRDSKTLQKNEWTIGLHGCLTFFFV